MKKYLLEFVVFTTGGVLMILELCGSRILAPYVGTSITVWTSLIGIILGSLSLGYYVGGKVADRSGSHALLSLIIFMTSLFIAFIILIRDPMLAAISILPLHLGIQATLSTIVLFFMPSILLGMVTPIATRLRIKSLKTAGGAVGNLYAFSTVGSIVGTFLAGFILLAYFSVTQILVGLSLTLFLVSLILSSSDYMRRGGILAVILVGVWIYTILQPAKKVYESRYNHIEIVTQGSVKILQLDNKLHSAIYTNSDELVFKYSKYYDLAKLQYPQAQKILMIGGGAYSVPKHFLTQYDDIVMDVVEIDPFLTELAIKEFGLQKDPGLRIYHEDGRTFLNREVGKKQYDAILLDAFSSLSIPFHLTTVEAIEKMDRLLDEEGVIVTNIISSIEGEKGKFLQAEMATYKKVFPYVTIYPVNTARGEINQNIILVASKKPLTPLVQEWVLNKPWEGKIASLPVLTDDFAPIDQYVRANER